MGVVHLASGPDGSRVALKVLRPHVVGDREGRERLAREVTSLQRVRSARVAEFLDADPWGPIPYVVTRFVPGLSLSDYVGEYGPMRGQPVLRMAGGLAEALAAVHAVGVVHRDVKPSNVLIEGGEPVLIDFGLARAAEDASLTVTGWMMGTPAYLSPEIALGLEPGPATDVHSWATTVAYACRGSSPFGRGPQPVLLDRVRRNEYDLEGVPPDLREVLVACLASDPQARPSATVLAGWLAGPHGAATATVHVPAAPQPPRVATQVLRGPTDHPPWSPVGSGAGSGSPTAAPFGPVEPPPVRRPPAERVAAVALWTLVSLLAVAVFAAMPYVSATLGWLGVATLVTCRQAVEALRRRRSLRGVRRGDRAVATVTAPWHVVRGIAHAAVLVGTAMVAAGLVDGLLHLGAVRARYLVWAGAVAFCVVLWRGPGGHVLHRPMHRVVDRGASAGVWAFALCWVLAALVAGTIALVQGVGTIWFPADGPPL